MADNGNEAATSENEASPDPIPVPDGTPKVKKQSPQRGVDEFWENFTTKFPGKVYNVLPSNIYAKTKALNSPNGIVNGQKTLKAYDQAVSECKHAVDRISKECRRVNHKYRDPHFDIEFDLKRGTRDCLDGLEIDEYDMPKPRSVKRVPDIFEDPKFFEEGATASDVRQGKMGDCWFLAALCAISNKKDLIDKICVARDVTVGVYGFVFHRDGEWIQTVIDDKLYLIASDWEESSIDEKRTFEDVNPQGAEEKYRRTYQTGSKALYFAQCRSENETWLPLLEKACAKAHGDYSSINGGFTGEAIEDLTGGVTTELFSTDILDKEEFWTEELKNVNQEFLFGCSTGTFDEWQGLEVAGLEARSGVVRRHAYSIMEAVEKKGERLVRVRNPWATDEWRGPWSDGSEQWTPEWMELLNHRFGDDGMFWMSYKDLMRKYSYFHRTRLFGADWQITQQWTTVDVPWSADYNDTKFSITLTKRSPIVIVLSQLDDRYFKGMQGQYDFQLHFRLEKDGDDDYIVRSHGNYNMRRSVSTDLELDAGSYSVLMKITATRSQIKSTPEDTIRANCKYRQSKLVQIGLAYDLAHAKGEIVETEEEKEEKQKREEKKKAADEKKRRDAARAKRFGEWEYNRKLRAREKRHAMKKTEREQKKTEKQKGERPDKGSGSTGLKENGATVAAGLEGKAEKEATAGAKEATNAESTGIEATLPSPPADIKAQDTNIDKSKTEETTRSNEASTHEMAPTSSAQKAKQFEVALQLTPSVTINGTSPASSTAPAPAFVAAPSSVALSDNSQYESDTSFDSSVESLLDFPRIDSPLPSPLAVNDAHGSGNVDERDKEFENDPWNAVCVVGLRVYSKDDGCCVGVVRPRQEVDDEDTPLDLDDASKGASREVGGNVKEKKSESESVDVVTGLGESRVMGGLGDME